MRVGLLAQGGQLLGEGLARARPRPASVSFLSACSSISSWMMRRCTASSSGGTRVDLDAQPAGRLVDQVDRLVRQEAVGDVAVREHRRGDQRGVLDAHAVVDLVALLEPAQDGDGVLDRRLAHQHRLEAPLQRRVLLDVLAVLVERGGADGAQLAAGQHRLQQVGRVHRALGRARADDRVQLVDEEDDLALGVGDLLEDGLEPVLELARGTWRRRSARPGRARRRACRAGPRARRRSTMRWARPSTIAVLPTPGSPISTGLFLVRRDSTWMTRRISSSRPMTGSSLPAPRRAR